MSCASFLFYFIYLFILLIVNVCLLKTKCDRFSVKLGLGSLVFDMYKVDFKFEV